MNYFCRHCDQSLKNGQQICSCGQIFANPVPEKDDEVGVVYWEPPKSTSAESRVQSIQETWENINPAAKAVGFSGLAILLIVFVIAGNHHTAPVVQPQIATAPVVRSAPSAESPAPTAPAPLVLTPPPPVILTAPQNSTDQPNNDAYPVSSNPSGSTQQSPDFSNASAPNQQHQQTSPSVQQGQDEQNKARIASLTTQIEVLRTEQSKDYDENDNDKMDSPEKSAWHQREAERTRQITALISERNSIPGNYLSN